VTLASLMVPSRTVILSLKGQCEGLELGLHGDKVEWLTELGWRRAFEALEALEISQAASGPALRRTETPRSRRQRPLPWVEKPSTPVVVEEGESFDWIPGDGDHPNPVLFKSQTHGPPLYGWQNIGRSMAELGLGVTKTVDSLLDSGYLVVSKKRYFIPTKRGRDVWLKVAPLFRLRGERKVFETDYTATMEDWLGEVADGRRTASEVWETMRDEFLAACAAAKEAGNMGPLASDTRFKLQEYLAAVPTLAEEIGDLDSLTEQEGRTLLVDLRTRGFNLLPSEKQLGYLQRMLEDVNLTQEEAIESANLRLAGAELNRDEASALIRYLSTLLS
jgi:hypothetical protein